MAIKEVWNDPKPGTNFRTRTLIDDSKLKNDTSKGQVSLGGKMNPNASPLIASAFAQAGGGGLQVYKYPLDGEADFPAKMKFTIHQVDAYTINPDEIASYFDVPLIARALGLTTESTTTEPASTARDGGNPGGTTYAAKTATEAEVADFGNADDLKNAGVDVSANKGRSSTFNQFEYNRNLAAAEGQAVEDTKKPNRTNLKTSLVEDAPIIQIYMPQSLQVNDDIAYNQADLGPGGLSAIAAINSGASLVGAVSKGLSEGLESIFNLARGQISETAAQVVGARLSQAIPKAGLRAAASTALQRGINPGTRMIFDRPNVRQFTFTFRFISTSSAEATQVEKIIKTFREEMYPETVDIIEGVPAGYKFPNLFQVEFSFLGGQAKFPKMQLSYLRSCQVTYNPNSMSYHPDGQPTEVDMTLVFQEYRALSKQDIQKGY